MDSANLAGPNNVRHSASLSRKEAVPDAAAIAGFAERAKAGGPEATRVLTEMISGDYFGMPGGAAHPRP